MLPKRIIALAACLFVSLCTGTAAKADPVQVEFIAQCRGIKNASAAALYGSPAVSNLFFSASTGGIAYTSLRNFQPMRKFLKFTATGEISGDNPEGTLHVSLLFLIPSGKFGRVLTTQMIVPINVTSSKKSFSLEITPDKLAPMPPASAELVDVIFKFSQSGSGNLVLSSLQSNDQPVSLLTDAPEARCP